MMIQNDNKNESFITNIEIGTDTEGLVREKLHFFMFLMLFFTSFLLLLSA